jgi:hypothetical protein
MFTKKMAQPQATLKSTMLEPGEAFIPLNG